MIERAVGMANSGDSIVVMSNGGFEGFTAPSGQRYRAIGMAAGFFDAMLRRPGCADRVQCDSGRRLGSTTQDTLGRVV